MEVECYPIGAVRMMDEQQNDDKIIAIPLQDPTWNYYKDLDQLPPHILNQIVNFFEVYKTLEHKSTALCSRQNRQAAIDVIRQAMEQYERHFCGRME